MSRGPETKAIRALVFAIALNGALTVGQVVVGIVSRSLAVAADAAHQFVDVVALTIAFVAIRATAKPPSQRRTYGLLRTDALGALSSSILLLLSVGWIAIEAVRRLFEPEVVRPTPMIIIGALGAVINGASAILVHRSGAPVDHGHGATSAHDQKHGGRLSTSAARLHLITDAFGSIVVLIGGLVLSVQSIPALDPIASFILCALIVPLALRLLRTSGDVLLDSVPGHLDVSAIAMSLRAAENVVDVHHLHVWSLGQGTNALSAHVEVAGETSVHASQAVLDSLQRLLDEEYGIRHSTLQLECHPCDDRIHV